MNGANYRKLLQSVCFLAGILLSGCAAPKSVIVLLPEDGRVGEVTVANPQGSQVLNQSRQAVEIAGARGRPASPTVLDRATVRELFGEVLSTLPLQPVRYRLYFKLGSAELLPDSERLLPVIAQAVKERKPAQLSVVGHTDTMGSADYNHRLGLLRARAVPELLGSQGAAPAGIEISSRGEGDLLVKTADQTPEPLNRRAEVTVR